MKINDNPSSLDTIRRLIEVCGGNSKFSKRFRIPIRSVENWKRGVNNPPEYLLLLLQYAVDHDLDFSDS